MMTGNWSQKINFNWLNFLLSPKLISSEFILLDEEIIEVIIGLINVNVLGVNFKVSGLEGVANRCQNK